MKRITQLFTICMIASLILTGLTSCKDDDDSTSCEDDQASTGVNNVWEEFIGTDTLVPALPDTYSNYFAYSFERTSPNMGIRINGEFASARYMSYNLYDVEVGTSFTAILDKDMTSKECSSNHFANEEEETYNRYSVNIVPDGTDVSDLDNPMEFDGNINRLSIMIRYYVPQADKYGGVPLPSVEAFDINTGEILELPAAFNLDPTYVDIDDLTDLVEPLFDLETPDVIRFYNANSGGLYPNLHNHYLAAPITKEDNQVYMFRFRAPSYVSDDSEIGTKDVRYFSINQGGVSTRNFAGLKDEDFIIGSDGFITLVIADDEPAVRQKADGLNFMPWKVASGDMILLYRNLVINEDFPNGTNSVPLLDKSLPPVEVIGQAGNFHIGEYAPLGLKMTKAEYLLNFGGFEVSY